jgi:hypothetical protein
MLRKASSKETIEDLLGPTNSFVSLAFPTPWASCVLRRAQYFDLEKATTNQSGWPNFELAL